MAYIAPDSTIRFHKNIVLDNTYDHTYYFDSITAQNEFFSDRSIETGKVLFELDNYSYQRHTSNSIRIARPASAVMNCSYISFKNSAFENKWFYAFLTDYEYVNNSTTIIYYEIDVMQTFMFDIEWKQCYIERQHTISDNIGDNLIPESLDLGEYQYVDFGLLETDTSEYKLVIAATFTGTYDQLNDEYTFTDAGGNTYGGIYSGVYPNVFSYQTVGGWYLANKFLIDATRQNKSTGIVSVFMLPADFFYYDTLNNTYRLNSNAKESVFPLTKGTNWLYDNHVCKNNKLYTYPYTLLSVDNGQGNCANFRWEYFTTNNAVLKVYYTGNSSPELVCVPVNYNGLINNYNERIIINNIPQCAYAIDSYLAWLAQNNTKWNVALGGTIIGSLAGAASLPNSFLNNAMYSYSFEGSGANMASPLAAGSLIAGGIKVANLLAEKHVASTMPPHVSGTEANVANISTHNFGFRAYNVHVRPEYARIIDDYFTRYGYAIHQNAVPNLCARKRFTYVKTVDCTIEAEIANEYTQKIVSIMNNGITFWNDKTYIGNYERPNEVISG